MNGIKSFDERLTVALNEVFNSLNVLGRNGSETVREVFRTQHRTLQQQFMRVVIIPVLQTLSEAHTTARTDPRNDAAARLATKMLAAVTEDDLYLPLI